MERPRHGRPRDDARGLPRRADPWRHQAGRCADALGDPVPVRRLTRSVAAVHQHGGARCQPGTDPKGPTVILNSTATNREVAEARRERRLISDDAAQTIASWWYG